MSLTSAFAAASGSLAANTAQSNLISRNIGNVNTPGYSLKQAQVQTATDGIGYIASISRATDTALQGAVIKANANAATQETLSAAYSQLAQTIGTSGSGQSISDRLSALGSALQTAAASPGNSAGLQAAVSAAKDLASGLNSASTAIQGLREQTDADMAQSVSSVNDLLGQFRTLNDQVISGAQTGSDVTDQMDARDQIIGSLSKLTGVSSVSQPNGGLALYTDSGVTLFDKVPRTVTFQPKQSFADGTIGNAVKVDGVDITSPTSPMPLRSGQLAADVQVRDSITVTYQNQLNEVARGLVNAFSEKDQTGGSAPQAPGLFTWPGAPAMPANQLVCGIAQNIDVNSNIDPAQGGNATLLRDGGIASTSNSAYKYNPSGAAGFSTRLQDLASSLSQTQSFDNAAGLSSNISLTDFANASISWVSAGQKSAADNATQQGAIRDQATQALSSSTGVNLDTEMSRMLDIENSYQASAKLLTGINSMFTDFFQAI